MRVACTFPKLLILLAAITKFQSWPKEQEMRFYRHCWMLQYNILGNDVSTGGPIFLPMSHAQYFLASTSDLEAFALRKNSELHPVWR